MLDQATIDYLNEKYHPEPTETYAHNHAPIEANRIADKVEEWYSDQMTQVENSAEFNFHLLTISDTVTKFTFRETHIRAFREMVTKLVEVGNNLQALNGLDSPYKFKAVRLMTAKPNGNSCPHLHLNHLVWLKKDEAEAWLAEVKGWLGVVATKFTISHAELGIELNTDMVGRLFRLPETDHHGEVLDLVKHMTQTGVNSFTERTVLDFFSN